MIHTTIEERNAIRDAVAALTRDRSTEADVRAAMETAEGFDPALWRELAAMGVVGLLVAPEFGGAGLGPVELELVAEAMGAALLCSPFLSSSVLATGLLAASGDRGAQAAHLPGIAAGTTIATAALTSKRGDWTPEGVAVEATGEGDAAALTGVADYVTHGQAADLLLVAARIGEEIGLFAVAADAPGVTRTPLPTFDRTLRLSRINFRDTPAVQVGRPGWAPIRAALDLALVAMAGEQAGGARRVFEMTVDYARTRIQFGRPIGSFQAIKHMAADRLLDVETATSAARDAAEALAEGGARAAAAVPLAAFACAEAYGRVAADAIQMHGGIAFTWAHPAHLYLRRARATAQLFGASPFHRERFLEALERPAATPASASAAAPGADDDPDRAALRAEVRAWLAANWRDDLPTVEDKWRLPPEVKAWFVRVLDAGWGVPTWPEAWFGRGLDVEQALVVDEEFARVGAPGARQDKSNLAACTIFDLGDEAMKRAMIPPLLRRELTTCLLYSEPAAGSDLAGIRTRADRDGDEFVIDGQKVWTSGAAHADYGMLIARTDWDAPKHAGITFFMLPMKQPGVEVRPLPQVTGESHFNEVFITGARAPAANIVGLMNGGWRVLQTALAYERGVMGEGPRGARRERVSDDLAALARARGRLDDPALRQDLAGVLSLRRLLAVNNARGKAALERGDTSSPVMSLGKLAMSRVLHEEARMRTAILEAESLLDGPEHPLADDANFLALNAYFTSIGGGTDQIQRNIIAERVLGLPREVEPDRGVPFREVRSG